MNITESNLEILGSKVKIVSGGNLAIVHIDGRHCSAIEYYGDKLEISHTSVKLTLWEHVMYEKYGSNDETLRSFVNRLSKSN